MGWFDWFLRAAPPALPPVVLEPVPSDELVAFLQAWEGCRLDPYKDVAGHWTIGYGHVMLPHEPHERITQERAAELLDIDLAYHFGRVRDLVDVELTQAQIDALTDFCFNLGSKALASSTLLTMINAGHLKEAAGQFERWNKARIDGVLWPVEGLTKRRKAEREMYLFADYRGRP